MTLSTTPDDWVEEDEFGYSPSRYDPDKYNRQCKKCEADLMKAGDRAGAIAYCPECEVTVFSL